VSTAPVQTNYPYIVAKMRQLAPALRPAIARGLHRGLQATSSTAQRQYLSGPRPTRLGVVTTRLRNSISIDVKDHGREVAGRIGSNVVYAAYHERGFRGIQWVKAHTRVTEIRTPKGFVLNGDVLARKRGAIRDKVGRIVGYRRSMKVAAGLVKNGSATVEFVAAHRRKVSYLGRPYILPALVKTEKTIARSVESALKAAVVQQTAGPKTGGTA